MPTASATRGRSFAGPARTPGRPRLTCSRTSTTRYGMYDPIPTARQGPIDQDRQRGPVRCGAENHVDGSPRARDSMNAHSSEKNVRPAPRARTSNARRRRENCEQDVEPVRAHVRTDCRARRDRVAAVIASMATEPDDTQRARPPAAAAAIAGVGGTAASRFSGEDDPEGMRRASAGAAPGSAAPGRSPRRRRTARASS